MIAKRIIPCLYVRQGRVVKGNNFEGPSDVSSPVGLARFYSDNGADELVFYDINTTADERRAFSDILQQTARQLFIPLTVGGSVSDVEDFAWALQYGADKVSVNSGAVENPTLIRDAANRYGAQCVVLSVDVKQVDGIWRVFTHGGRDATNLDALQWIRHCVDMGAGEIVVNSLDADLAGGGFDLPLLQAVCDAVKVPVTASGGATQTADFVQLFTALPQVDAALAAATFHCGAVSIRDLKQQMVAAGIPTRT